MEKKGSVNIYFCRSCGAQIVTKLVDDGTTPFMLMCKNNPLCDEMMQSTFYPEVAKERTVTHEWYKEKIKSRMEPDEIEYIKLGGLSLRDVNQKKVILEERPQRKKKKKRKRNRKR